MGCHHGSGFTPHASIHLSLPHDELYGLVPTTTKVRVNWPLEAVELRIADIDDLVLLSPGAAIELACRLAGAAARLACTLPPPPTELGDVS